MVCVCVWWCAEASLVAFSRARMERRLLNLGRVVDLNLGFEKGGDKLYGACSP
jgi:hypothetical protein